MITRFDIEEAAARIAPHIRETPVRALPACAAGLDHPVQLKLELEQRSGSFKARGAFNSLLSADVPPAGVAASSGGNHGAAISCAAQTLGHQARIFVPEAFVNRVKIARIRSYYADVVTVPGPFSAALAAQNEYAAKNGAITVHPYDQPSTLAGQGTLGRELEAQDAGLDVLLVAVGGGGLIGGIAAWYQDRIRIIAVETEGTATLASALSGGNAGGYAASGIAIGSLGAPDIGTLPFSILKDRLAGNVTVTDVDVIKAQRRLWDATGLVAEPGGVVALAALTSGRWRPQDGQRVGVVICGSNAAPDWFRD